MILNFVLFKEKMSGRTISFNSCEKATEL